MKKNILTSFAVIFLFLLIIEVFPSKENRGVRIISKDGKIVKLYGNSYALLIGVSDYINGWSDLKSVPKEIDDVETALKKHEFKVEKVLNSTYEDLKRIFEDFIGKYGFKTNNRLLFFFSGHGYTRKNGEKGYIVPSDAPNPILDEIGFVRKAVEMEQIIAWAKRIEAKHALFLFDSCFSGTIFKTKALTVPRYISYLTANPVKQFITAGSAGEEIPAKSLFTPSFIRGIDGEADSDNDGYVTGSELGIYLQKELLSYQVGQTPQYGKIREPDLEKGDFVFKVFKPTIPTKLKIDLSKYKKESAHFNLGKVLFYNSISTDEYILITTSFDEATRYENFNTNNVHVLLEMKNGKTIPFLNEELEIISIGRSMDEAIEKNSILFRFNLILDNSSSISKNHLVLIQKALTKFIKNLPTVFDAQIIKISDRVQIKTSFTRDKQLLIDSINQKVPQGSLSLYDAIDLGINELIYSDDNTPFRFSIFVTAWQYAGGNADFRPNDIFMTKKNSFPLFIILATDDFGPVPIPHFMDEDFVFFVGKFFDFDGSARIRDLIKNLTKFKKFSSIDFSNKNEESQKKRKAPYIKKLYYCDIDQMLMLFTSLLKDTYIIKIPAVVKYEYIKIIYLFKQRRDGKFETIQDFIIDSKQPKMFVTNLSFMDARTKSLMAQTEIAELINEAVHEGMIMGERLNDDLAIIENKPAVASTDTIRLANITFDPNLSKSEKIKKIVSDLMEPYGVDAIVTGHYIDEINSSMISVLPLIIVKSKEMIRVKNLLLTKKELLCEDPVSKKKILCKIAYDGIALAVKELLENL